MALGLSRELEEQLLGRPRRDVLAGESEAGGEAGDQCGRGGAHAACGRDCVLAAELERRQLLTKLLGRLLRHLYDEVLVGRDQPVGALAVDLQGELVGPLHRDLVPHVHGEAKGVEASAEVGGRGRNLDHDLVHVAEEGFLDLGDAVGRPRSESAPPRVGQAPACRKQAAAAATELLDHEVAGSSTKGTISLRVTLKSGFEI